MVYVWSIGIKQDYFWPYRRSHYIPLFGLIKLAECLKCNLGKYVEVKFTVSILSVVLCLKLNCIFVTQI